MSRFLCTVMCASVLALACQPDSPAGRYASNIECTLNTDCPVWALCDADTGHCTRAGDPIALVEGEPPACPEMEVETVASCSEGSTPTVLDEGCTTLRVPTRPVSDVCGDPTFNSGGWFRLLLDARSRVTLTTDHVRNGGVAIVASCTEGPQCGNPTERVLERGLVFLVAVDGQTTADPVRVDVVVDDL